ncbi:putative transmembrane protein 179-like [Scophthalmus maximus]|uniref:Putative transmembrane protein 179-like n=1 Tax=Scophthalmus maximus TaxID=52904 RepID=A0A2U9C6V9_SCOMX|nr:transmembrane protein 179-like [Scophthalmus maximus]AWP11943.1 putative transmembrane protein 179-like [Scophthalmus maximus]
MELDRRLLSAHCAVHALSIAAGLLVVVPMALNGSAFKGRCALFSTGYWRAETRGADTEPSADASHLVVQQWGPLAACQFATFVGIFTVLYGAAQSWRGFFYLHGRHDDTLFSSFLTVLLSVCVLFLSGGASVLLSLGLVSWCDTVTDNNTRPYSCAESQSVPLYLDVDTSSFYTELSLAQASLWCVTALWLAQSILAFLRLYHSHSQHISGPCLPREKELLLGHSPSECGSSPSPPLPSATPTLLV